MKNIIYISGGVRSGKSKYALNEALNYKTKVYLATAEPFDEETKYRINKHKKERNEQFITIEEPLNIADTITNIASKVDVILLDCITMWLNNLFYYKKDISLEASEISNFLLLLKNPPTNIVIVSNEIGMGLVPENELSRKYRDLAGFLNQEIARLSTKAIFMVSGLEIVLKDIVENLEN